MDRTDVQGSALVSLKTLSPVFSKQTCSCATADSDRFPNHPVGWLSSTGKTMIILDCPR